MKYRRLFGGFYPKNGVTHRKILGIMSAAFGPWSEKSENSHVGTDGMVDINFYYIPGLLPEEEFSFFLKRRLQASTISFVDLKFFERE